MCDMVIGVSKFVDEDDGEEMRMERRRTESKNMGPLLSLSLLILRWLSHTG